MEKYYIHMDVDVIAETELDGSVEELHFYCRLCGKELPGPLAPFPCRKGNHYYVVKDNVGYAIRWTGSEVKIRALYVKDYLNAYLEEPYDAFLYIQPEAEKPLLEMARARVKQVKGELPAGEPDTISFSDEMADYLEALLESGAAHVELVPKKVEIDEKTERELEAWLMGDGEGV